MAIFIFLLSVSYWSLTYCESEGDRVIKLLALAPWPDIERVLVGILVRYCYQLDVWL